MPRSRRSAVLASVARNALASLTTKNGNSDAEDDAAPAATRRRSSSRTRFPATIESSTLITEEKINNRRKSRRQAKKERELAQSQQEEKSIVVRDEYDKENTTNLNVMQSPTPYWKVAKERGGRMSPRETRSNKKKKKKSDKDEDEDSTSGRVLNFSPPDQVANARREKEDLTRKESERTMRVQKAKDEGQLLIFSPTLRNPAKLPDEAELSPKKVVRGESTCGSSEKNSDGNSKLEPVLNGHKGNQCPTGTEEKLLTPQNMELELHGASQSTNGSSELSNAHSEHIASELRSLRETISKLVEPKEKDTPSKALLRQHEIDKLSLEAQSVHSKTLNMANSKLEEKNERLSASVKELEAMILKERGNFVVEKTRLESELSCVNRESEARVEGLEKLRQEIQAQLTRIQKEKNSMEKQVSKLQEEVAKARDKLKDSKNIIQALKKEREAEKDAMEVDHEHLGRINEELSNKLKESSNLSSELNDIRAENEALKQKISEYEEKIDTLENHLLPESESQLEEALEEVKQHQKAIRETESQMKEYETQVENLKEELKEAYLKNEKERSNFEILNKDSSDAYDRITEDIDAKDLEIRELKKQLREMKRALDDKTKQLQDMSQRMDCTQSDMNSRLREVEQALNETIASLDKSTQDKTNLEQKLKEALEQVDKDADFKEQVLFKNKQVSTSLQEMDAQRLELQRRVEDMEEKLKIVTDERDEAVSRMETFDDREQELFLKLRESDRVRRDLHNRVMQLSGNIRVYVRVRPTLPNEVELDQETVKANTRRRKRKVTEIDPDTALFRYPDIYDRKAKKSNIGADDLTKNLLEVTEPYKDRGGLSERRKKWTFGFDHVFNPSHEQQDLWEATEPIVQSAIDGYNVTIFAYGQTGSGKTYTMLGEPGNEGIIFRSVQKLFDAKREIKELSRDETNVELSVELLEIYNEKVRDLLVSGSGPDGKELSLRVTSDEVIGNICLDVDSEDDVANILDLAQKRRCVKATASNAVSSRSHMLFTIHFKVTSKGGIQRSGRLNVCDLAGSERLNKSKANSHVRGALLTETKHINTSLSVLSNVIEKLQAQDSNVPFRESKLTFLLQNSLGGNSKTLAIVCCSPSTSHFHESLCSLRFAAKVNKVDLKAVANFSC